MILFNELFNDIVFEEVFNSFILTGVLGYGMLMMNELIIFLI